MNPRLTEEIAYHILANLGVLPSNFIALEHTKSVLDKNFLLTDRLTLIDADKQTTHKNIYGCQISITNNKEFKLLLADCTQEKNIPEYCLIVQLKDAPIFGLYLVFNRLVKETVEPEALIAVNTDKKHWIPCTTYLQATFLAGMEQLRDLQFGWNKCTAYRELYDHLLSFMQFHNDYFGGMDEGQEG